MEDLPKTGTSRKFQEGVKSGVGRTKPLVRTYHVIIDTEALVHFETYEVCGDSDGLAPSTPVGLSRDLGFWCGLNRRSSGFGSGAGFC